MFNKIFAITLNTYRESIRSKILYAMLLFAAMLIGVSVFLGAVSIGDQIKVIKDFGLFSLSVFTVSYAVIAGAQLLSKELKLKTVYNILSRPVRRSEFLVGKYSGMLLTVLSMLLIMALSFSCFLYFLSSALEFNMLQAYWHIFLELMIVCASVIFFSSIVVTPLLSGLFAFGLFLAGRSSELFLYFIESGELSGAGAFLLKALYYLVPNYQKISIANAVVYDLPIEASLTLWCSVYAIGYSLILLAIAQLAFQRRDFN